MKPLFLVGYRGTGKSTVARLLAPALGCECCDADIVLQERAGKTIAQMFRDNGETYFRDLESTILEELSMRENLVVATGGGVVMRQANRVRLKAGSVVWLNADAATIWRRLQNDPATAVHRPDLAQGGFEEIEQLLHERSTLYAACADLTVNATRPPAEMALEIAHWVQRT